MTSLITESEFDHLLKTFERSAFRLETRDSYALGYERADFERFLAGTPRGPAGVDWWEPWLRWIKNITREGKRLSRVRILAEPPTDYQRWEMWGEPWHITAGEQVRHMPRTQAETIGLPIEHDWWLLDDERVIAMWFTDAGEIDHKELITDRGTVARYCAWRDLAVRNANPAESVTAA